MRTALLALFLVPALAGCLSDDAAPNTGENAADATQYPPATLFLDHAGLASESPDESVHTLGWSLTEWVGGVIAPEWIGSGATNAYVIEHATATIVYETLVPLAHTDTRPPFTIWFGAGDSIIEHAFMDGPNPWLPGDVQTITFDIDSLPAGGLVVAPGEMPVLRVGSYYTDNSALGAVQVHLGPDASRVDWHIRPLALPETTPDAPIVMEESLLGGRCVAPLNIEGSAQYEQTFEVDSTVVGIDAKLTRLGGIGAGPDLDFFLMDATGADIAHAAGSAAPEAIHLRAPNMDATEDGTWAVAVYNCQPQSSDFRLELTLLRSVE